MKRKGISAIFAAVGLFILIIDNKAAIVGAKDGLALCLQVAIPSLLPFFVLSMVLTSHLSSSSAKPLRPLGKLCKLPNGCEHLLLIGLLGGYPSGAQNVAMAYKNGQLTRKEAQRLYCFCNNAGPAFLFGMLSSKFHSPRVVWLLWAIHILSAICVSVFLPGIEGSSTARGTDKPLTLTQALKQSIYTLASVCGWIILFRVAIAYLDKWVLFHFSLETRTTIAGLIELINGCSSLEVIKIEGLRFLLAAALLALGGLCVTMQTVSVATDIDLRLYLKGKLLQCLFSICLALAMQFVFPQMQRAPMCRQLLCVALVTVGILYREFEKNSSIPEAIGV